MARDQRFALVRRSDGTMETGGARSRNLRIMGQAERRIRALLAMSTQAREVIDYTAT